MFKGTYNISVDTSVSFFVNFIMRKGIIIKIVGIYFPIRF